MSTKQEHEKKHTQESINKAWARIITLIYEFFDEGELYDENRFMTKDQFLDIVDDSKYLLKEK